MTWPRRAFLRAAFAAAATGWFVVYVPRIESEPVEPTYFGSARVCVRCGKPDREVDVGFLECRPCWEITSAEAVASWDGSFENEYVFRAQRP